MSTTTPPGHSPLPSSPPEAWEPLLRFARLAGRPLERFLRIEAASGILLFVAALRHIDVARREAMSPAESLIETLHPWVAFGSSTEA